MDDLVTWLLEQVAEDEREATAAFSGQCDPENGWGISGRAITPHVGVIHEDVQRAHVAKWNPARVLAECEAKRKMIALHCRIWLEPGAEEFNDAHLTREPMPVCAECRPEGMFRRAMSWPCRTLKALARPYADRPGYREDWQP